MHIKEPLIIQFKLHMKDQVKHRLYFPYNLGMDTMKRVYLNWIKRREELSLAA